MTTRGSAARYARALLDVAVTEHVEVQAERDLASFADLLQGHPELKAVLMHPAVPAARKHAVVEGLLARAAFVKPVAKLLLLLATRDRLVLVPDLLTTYRDRLLEHQQVVRAEVTTAEPLPAGREADIQSRLASATGRKVLLTTRVDPSIIGGIVARIGSTVYDGSLAAQLTKMRERLSGRM